MRNPIVGSIGMPALHTLLLVSSFLVFCSTAFAGQYVRVPGTSTAPNPSGGTWYRDPVTVGLTGWTGAFWDNQDQYYGCSIFAFTHNGPTCTVSATGKITTKFQWVADPNKPGEPHPKNVIITEHSKVEGYGGASANERMPNSAQRPSLPVASNGINTPDIPPDEVHNSIHWSRTQKDEGFATRIMPGADLLVIECDVNAFGEAIAPQYGDAYALVDIAYKVTKVEPVVIDLEGANSADAILTGQKVRASIKAGTYQFVPGKYTWTVTGGDPFRDAVYTSELGKRDELESPIDYKNEKMNFFTAANGDVIVKCTADVILPSGAEEVKAEIKLTSKKPTLAYWNILSAPVRFEGSPPNGPIHLPNKFLAHFFAVPQTPTTPAQPEQSGQDWKTSIVVPSPFSGGTGAFVQVMVPERYAVAKLANLRLVPPPYPNGVAYNGTKALDGTFPYHSWSVPAVGSEGDSPEQTVADFDTLCWQVKGSGVFNTWVMYEPPANGIGTCYIPIEKYTWSWQGIATQQQSNGQWSSDWTLGNIIGAAPTVEHVPTGEFPNWVRHRPVPTAPETWGVEETEEEEN